MINITYTQFKIWLVVLGLFIVILAYEIGSYRGYNQCKNEMEHKYLEQSQQLSKELTDSLQAEFKLQQERLNKVQEMNHEKLQTTLEEYKSLGKCHTTNGISLLNEQINKRNTGTTTTK